MTLILNIPLVDENEENPWLKEGISAEDMELARECNLLTPRVEITDYEKMIEEQEKFYEEGDEFYEEMVKIQSRNKEEEEERIIPGKEYKDIEVRIIMKKKNFSIGSIDGSGNVYIPISLSKNLSIGSIHKMNLIYKPTEKNVWKAIYVHMKVEPNVISEFLSNGINFVTFHIPEQNIGKMIGKNGICIQKVLNDYTHNNKVFNINMNEEYVPKIDAYNENGHTVVHLWDKFDKRMESCLCEMDIIEDFLKKMYC